LAEVSRADARRNYELLLTHARNAFAEHGTEASLRDVARRAGVGIGTLYRHFPTRDALLEAVLRDGFDRLRERADTLTAASLAPRDALLEWLRELATGSSTYRGLPESVLAALRDKSSPLHAACSAMRTAGSRLLDRAQRSGAVRTGITVDEMLALAAGIAWASEQSVDRSDTLSRLLSIAMFGLSTTDDRPQSSPSQRGRG
jgi:AcrR family transcriptional regulator